MKLKCYLSQQENRLWNGGNDAKYNEEFAPILNHVKNAFYHVRPIIQNEKLTNQTQDSNRNIIGSNTRL